MMYLKQATYAIHLALCHGMALFLARRRWRQGVMQLAQRETQDNSVSMNEPIWT